LPCVCASLWAWTLDCSMLPTWWGLWFYPPGAVPCWVSRSASTSLWARGPGSLLNNWAVFLSVWGALPLWLLHACMSVFMLCTSGSQCLGCNDPNHTRRGPLSSSCFVPPCLHLPHPHGRALCSKGLEMGLLRGEKLWREAGPTGLARPEQVGLLIWLTAASSVSCFLCLPLSPPHALLPCLGTCRGCSMQ
jgi:hypothetical protein